MVTLHAHDFKVGQPIQTHRLQLVEGYDTILVLVETLQNGLDDELGLPGVLNFVLPGTSRTEHASNTRQHADDAPWTSSGSTRGGRHTPPRFLPCPNGHR